MHESVKLTVRGMTCGNCARSVERKLAATPGVAKATVDLVNSNATVDYDASVVTLATLADTIRNLGYEVPA
jgi:Cu+-exporting ATPase